MAAPVAAAAPFFPFLFADEPARLARLFYGYIALGEWECAKATVRQLARHNSARARDMLLELITNGPPGTVSRSHCAQGNVH